jgi:hypothetical protein
VISLNRIFLTIGLTVIFSGIKSYAQTLDGHRSTLVNISSVGANKLTRPKGIWLSSITNNASSATLADPTGKAILSIPKIAPSGYDSSVFYNLSDFYNGANKPRLNFILNYASENYGEIFSLGFDSGTKAKKVELDKSFFVGYTRSVFTRNSYIFSFSTGVWLAGSLSESPCFDTYDREYHCPTLTAWSDYSPRKHNRRSYYIDLRLTF